MVDCHLEAQEQVRLWHSGDGRLIGYAILGEDPSFDCQVAPEYTGRGIEDEAVAWAEALLAARREHDAAQWGGHLVSGARESDADRIAWLQRHGFRRGEYAEITLLRALDRPIPAAPPPAGYCVRAVAGVDEAAARAAAQREVWQPWSVGRVGDADYTRFMGLPGTTASWTWWPYRDGTVAAYVNGWLDRSPHRRFRPVVSRRHTAGRG